MDTILVPGTAAAFNPSMNNSTQTDSKPEPKLSKLDIAGLAVATVFFGLLVLGLAIIFSLRWRAKKKSYRTVLHPPASRQWPIRRGWEHSAWNLADALAYGDTPRPSFAQPRPTYQPGVRRDIEMQVRPPQPREPPPQYTPTQAAAADAPAAATSPDTSLHTSNDDEEQPTNALRTAADHREPWLMRVLAQVDYGGEQSVRTTERAGSGHSLERSNGVRYNAATGGTTRSEALFRFLARQRQHSEEEMEEPLPRYEEPPKYERIEGEGLPR